MINLKLAQYNSEGKFERFLELGKDFTFGGDYVVVNSEGWRHLDPILEHKYPVQKLFDGLFLGRTYGGGRFVLEENEQDNIYDQHQIVKHILFKKQKDGSHFRTNNEILIKSDILEPVTLPTILCGTSGGVVKTKLNGDEIWEEKTTELQLVGNLHENPELWEKLK